ncbi:MAG: PIN domain-containing protein [Ardenticatenales bacterium]
MTGEAAIAGEQLVLLDSVIIIDHLNDIASATTYLTSVSDRSLLSAITRAEVMTGVARPNFERVRQLLDNFHCIAIDVRIADLAAELRRTWKWRLPDALQAAAAISVGGQLATRNTRDFDPSIHPFVVVPYRLDS